LPYLLLVPVYLLLWLSIPKTSEQGLPSFANWVSNLMPFLQTLVYPLLPLFRLSAEDTTALIILSLLALGLTFLAAWLARARALWLFGLGWFLFTSLPSTLFLSPDYLYGSPRLHYLPAVGVAMLWAMPVLALARHTPDQSWERFAYTAAGLVFTLAIILPPTIFIRCEMDFYEETSRVVRRMGDLGEDAPPGRMLLFVNLPVFFSSFAGHPDGCPNPYPWTPVGAVVIPDYANARDFVRFNGRSQGLATAVTVQEYMPGWNTYGDSLDVGQLRERLRINAAYIFDLNTGDFFDLSAVWLPGAATIVEPLVEFDAGLQLNSGMIERAGENEVAVTLIWQKSAIEGDEHDPAVFVHLYDAGGQLIAQHDAPPGNGFVPLAWWGEKDAVVDTHLISLPESLEAGQYQVAVGLYNPANGERYSAVDRNKAPVPDNAYVIGQLGLR
jgi:hypothetical protein